MFTAKLFDEHLSPDEDGNPRRICWKDVLEECHDFETVHLKVVSKLPSEEGCEVTFIMNKNHWPHLEDIHEAYEFAGYLEMHAYRDFSPGRPFTPSPESQPESRSEIEPEHESESQQAPIIKATTKRSKKKAKRPSKNKIIKQKKSKKQQQI